MDGNKSLAVDAIKKMFLAFGIRDVDRLKVYVEFLAVGFPAPLVVKACQKATMECKYLPTIAELISAVKSLVGEADTSRRTKTWAEAWGEIEKAMYRDGCSGREPKFADEKITLTVKYLGGIDVLATCPIDNFNTLRAQTRKIYEDVCRRDSEKQINAFILQNGDKLELEVGVSPKQQIAS